MLNYIFCGKLHTPFSTKKNSNDQWKIMICGRIYQQAINAREWALCQLTFILSFRVQVKLEKDISENSYYSAMQ